MLITDSIENIETQASYRNHGAARDRRLSAGSVAHLTALGRERGVGSQLGGYMDWYVTDGKDRVGPVTEAQVVSMLRGGQQIAAVAQEATREPTKAA